MTTFSTLARLHQGARYIWQEHQFVLKLLSGSVHLSEEFSRLRLELSNCGLCLSGLFLEPLLHKVSDFCGFLLLLCEQSIAFSLELAAQSVELEHPLHYRCGIKIFDSELLYHGLRVVAKHFECQHDSEIYIV